jgi:ATPase subunit of ABC transporter with duplicated ATPase domains
MGKVKLLCSVFPWPATRPLDELTIEAELIHKLAVDLKTAVVRENQLQSEQTEVVRRKAVIERRISELRSRSDRLSNAHLTLQYLRKEHSLRDAMKDALEQNRATIERIFARIHSPAEFAGLGANWTKVVRRRDRKEADLNEISSGQRTALAMAIFLSQNSQLTVGPPVMLIDDPIAHIDDLNSL